MDEKKQLECEKDYLTLLSNQKSFVMGSLDKDGKPYTSLAPYAMDEDFNFYILISEISEHFYNITHNKNVSIFIAEDEVKASNIYARTRVNFSALSEKIENDSTKGYELLLERFGNMIDHLKDMHDFHFFKIIPQKGRFIRGFGQSFDISKGSLDQIVHVKSGKNGHGHQQTKK